MRIFAVAQILHLDRLQVETLGKRRGRAVDAARGKPIGNRAVVRSGVRKRLLREREARCRGERPAVLRELREHHVVVRRLDDHADMLPVLRRGAQQRRTADVDVLDRVVERAAVLRDGLAKRVEIDDDEVDGGNRVRCQRRRMLGDVPPRENSGVHLRMERLDAAIEHLGKAGVVADLGDRKPGVRERLRRAARRQEPMPSPASPRANATSPVLSETESRACVMGADMTKLT